MRVNDNEERHSAGRGCMSPGIPRNRHYILDDFSPAQQEQIVRHYAPKIRSWRSGLAPSFPRRWNCPELISAGTLLVWWKRWAKFRPQLGIRFETYAENRIRGAMLDELRRLDWFPVHWGNVCELWRGHARMWTRKGPSSNRGWIVPDYRPGCAWCPAGAWGPPESMWLSLDAIQDPVSIDTVENGGEPYSQNRDEWIGWKNCASDRRLDAKRKVGTLPLFTQMVEYAGNRRNNGYYGRSRIPAAFPGIKSSSP